MKGRIQGTIGPCPACGGACVWTATDSPYEFAWACAAGDHGITSWSHADAPPVFTDSEPAERIESHDRA